MDYVWTPWRYRYLASNPKPNDCFLCSAATGADDAQSLVVLRAGKNFIILNRYPYTSGHVMIVPYVHEGSLSALDQATIAEMMVLAQRVQSALERTYHPDGYNLGMNLGRAGGAGVADHIHLHVLARWFGDTNFMTTVGETRLEPEDLAVTYQRLRAALAT